MQQPCYIFLPHDRYVLSIVNNKETLVTLIQPFDTEIRVELDGVFAESLLAQLHNKENSPASYLSVIEKQYSWLAGLSKASLLPSSGKQLVIGDELGLLFIEITSQCNERCIHCYASSSPECHEFLSLETIKSVLKQARVLGRSFVQFTGGEPLIHRELVEAVAYAVELNFKDIEIYTNGLLLNDKLIKQLSPLNPMLAFSLYSPDAEVHDRITQLPGSFKRTVSAIHRALKNKLRVRIGMAVMEENAGHEQAILDFVKAEFSLDPGCVRFDPVHQTGRGKSLDTQHISLLPSMNSHMPETKHHQLVHTDTYEEQLAVATKKVRRGKLAVCADGNVAPCIFNRQHVLGNIKSSTLIDILAEEKTCLGNIKPSVERWNHCQNNLSCADCQMVAYTLGEIP